MLTERGIGVATLKGTKLAVLGLTTTVMITAVVAKDAGMGSDALLWFAFASAASAGITSVLLSGRFGPFGTGHIMVVAGTGIFIAVAAQALEAGGPELLAILVAISGLIQWLLSNRLQFLRQVVTPVVGGTLLMLVAVSVGPSMVRLIIETPAGESAAGMHVSAICTIVVIVALAALFRRQLNQWIPIIGIGAGAVVGGLFGLFDTASFAAASWAGLPAAQWPGIDLSMNGAFWSMLPGFLLAMMVVSLRTITTAAAVMRVTGHSPAAVDFRLVQNALASEGAGNFFAGLAGGLPNMPLLGNAEFIRNSGETSRTIAVCAGLLMIVLALMPKMLALILAIPMSVLASVVLLAMVLLYVIGLRIARRDGLDRQGMLIIVVSLLTGIGAAAGIIRPASGALSGVLGNGLTAGGLCAILLTWGINLTYARAHRFAMRLELDGLARLQIFLRDLASRFRWSEEAANRLEMIGEEVLVTLLKCQDTSPGSEPRQLRLLARRMQGGIALEFVSVRDAEENLEDQIAVLSSHANPREIEQEVSLRILRHLASSVRHQQFYGTDILKVRFTA